MKNKSDVLVDREKLSASSQRSWSSCAKVYQDIHYRCIKCSCSSVFSAGDQKYTFEIKKSYIHQRRFLCNSCYTTAKELRVQHDCFCKLWIANKDRLQNDRQFMTSWLDLLELLVPYRTKNKINCDTMQARLYKLLKKQN